MVWALPLLAILLLCLAVVERPGHAQDAQKNASGVVIRPFLGGQGDAPALLSYDDMLPKWRLLPSEQIYASIDGKHLVQYVNDMVAIAYRYRDSGHQFWGRIMGFQGHIDAENYVTDKFKSIGLSDVHGVSLDLPPQWMAKSWEVSASGGGKTMKLATAYAGQNSAGTPAEGLDLEAEYVGLGSEADYHGLDVRGKAVVLFSIPLPAAISNSAGLEGALQRAQSKGAAAILEVILLPGNVRGQVGGGGKVPMFSVGMEEGYALRDLIALCPADRPAHVKIHMDVESVPNLKTSIIFGTLPGMTDEKVYVLAHLDSWFEGATDNGSGVATMLGLAEYFSKIPKTKRHRTIVFLGTPGHHNGKEWGADWLKDNNGLEKTALVINAEHTSAQGTHLYGWKLEKTNTADPQNWYMGGSDKFKDIAMKSALEFGVTMYDKPMSMAPGEMSPINLLVPSSIQIMNTNPPYFHSDGDDMVPYTQLEAVTRAYAKLITETDKMPIADLQAPKQ